MPAVGRLLTIVKPMPASASRRTARLAPSVKRLSWVTSVPSTSETTSAIRVMAGFRDADRRRSEFTHDVIDNLLNRGVDGNGDGVFVGAGRLQGLELALQQRRRHEMSFPRRQPACDQIVCAIEVDDAHVVAAMHQHVAIGALERRTGDYDMASTPADLVDFVGDGLQPGPAVLIGQRLSGAHLLHIGLRVKPVAVLIGPAKSFGQFLADRGFAGAGHAHHHDRAWYLVEFFSHENSPAMPRGRPAMLSRQPNARAPREDLRPPAPASGSGACPRRQPRTAFRGRSQAPATSA